MDLFYKYLLIGGLLESINTYIQTNNLSKVNDIQEKINEYYKKDIIQYASLDKRFHLETIYEILPEELNSKKQGEVDLMIEYRGNVLPIEVKSGKDYKKHSILDNLLKNKEYDIPQALILNDSNIEIVNNKIYLPIYMIMFIKKKD